MEVVISIFEKAPEFQYQNNSVVYLWLYEFT